MLYHHGSRDYDEAASAAAKHARDKLEGLIDRGRKQAADVVNKVTALQPVDRLVASHAVGFAPADAGLAINIGGDEEGLHPNAMRQAATRAGLPWTYVQRLTEPERRGWGPELLADNLNTLYRRQFEGGSTRFLLRSVKGETRAFLSDRYRRLDSRPLVDAFAATCRSLGAVPVDGFVSDTKVGLKAVLPQVFEPVRNEVLALGVMLENSDFGNGALSLRSFVLRLWCTNYAITEESIRAVHLGARLGDGVNWSDTTRQLDTASTASAIRDVVRTQLSADAVDALQGAVRAADEAKVSSTQVAGFLRRHLGKGEAQEVADAFNGPDVEVMPAGQTVWRLSNALSWVAGQRESAEDRLDLMKLAGKALSLAGGAA